MSEASPLSSPSQWCDLTTVTVGGAERAWCRRDDVSSSALGQRQRDSHIETTAGAGEAARNAQLSPASDAATVPKT